MKGLSVGEVGLGHINALPVVCRRDHPQRLWRVTRLFFIFLAGVMLLASCGNDDEEEKSTTQEIPAPPTIATSPAPTQVPSVSTTEYLPCHTDLEALQKIVPVAEPTPEVIRIQLLERPWRMIPSDIVLRQNRWYEFVITGGEEWHSFAVYGMGTRVKYEIPPGGEKAPWVHTTNAGVFVVENWRRIQESELALHHYRRARSYDCLYLATLMRDSVSSCAFSRLPLEYSTGNPGFGQATNPAVGSM